MIGIRKVSRSLTAAMPGWLILVCAVCLVIPLVRFAALAVTAALCLVQPARVRRAATAWRGGKSHRRFDERLADPSIAVPAPRSRLLAAVGGRPETGKNP